MDPAIETLESYGLVRDEDSLQVAAFSKTKILRLHRELYSVVFDRQMEDYVKGDVQSEIDPFSFVASKFLRGASDCGAYGCRTQKLDVLGRYAALYATRIILPLPIQAPSKVRSESQAAEQVSHAALALLRLRPLVDADLVFPVVMRAPAKCVHVLAWQKRMIALMQDVAYHAAKDFQGDFRVRFQVPEKAPTGLPSVYMEGPEDFLEHRGSVLLIDEPKGWRL